MKNLFLIALIFTTCQAQTDTSLLSVKYRFLHIKDTTKPEILYTENMQLFIGANSSMYKSADKEILDSIREIKINEQIKSQSGGVNFSIDMSNIKSADATIYYKNELTKTLSILHNLGQKYLIESSQPAINWTITSETKDIQNYTCQKATTVFKGRNFVAWFCADLPYSNGPWKLGGLPGLILEAYDPNGTVKFMFNTITKAVLPIELPKKVIKTTFADYTKLLDLRDSDPESYLKGQLGGIDMGGNLKVTVNSVSFNNSKKIKSLINNPIELLKD